ncbi:hypothetical protein MKZ38_009392 [Zalerion maritima]|uniref:Uncharacterized protein n=1 Tax=Zalerion maritima TaxID=339359 RepID=A0AAD5RUT4_9PEZI|nr:hypothetical protein MKZ38_009392 [Zalerion maritima]
MDVDHVSTLFQAANSARLRSVEDLAKCLEAANLGTESSQFTPLSGPVLLLTPVVQHLEGNTRSTDPFEPLGQRLSKGLSKEQALTVNHVPYIHLAGITDVHAQHIEKATSVIFCVSGPSASGQASQTHLARKAYDLAKNARFIILLCCRPSLLSPPPPSGSTVVEIDDYSGKCLEKAAGDMLSGNLRRFESSLYNLYRGGGG